MSFFCKKTSFALALLLWAGLAAGQGYVYGLKGGLSAGLQRWNNAQRDVLLRYNGQIFVESREEGANYSLFAQMGYHVKGSALRMRATNNPLTGQEIPARSFATTFDNLSLTLGGKSSYLEKENLRLYYSLGLRGDLTLDYNLELYPNLEDGVRRLTGGFTLGTGVEFLLNERTEWLIELQISPDVFPQIYVAPGLYYNTHTQQNQSFPEQRVLNTVVELNVGIRFLRD